MAVLSARATLLTIRQYLLLRLPWRYLQVVTPSAATCCRFHAAEGVPRSRRDCSGREYGCMVSYCTSPRRQIASPRLAITTGLDGPLHLPLSPMLPAARVTQLCRARSLTVTAAARAIASVTARSVGLLVTFTMPLLGFTLFFFEY